MRMLDFVVNKQNIEKQGDFSGLIAGTKNFLYARFSFSREWVGYCKVAVFTCRDGEFPVLLSNNSCKVPDEAAACSSFKVHVVARRGDEDIMSGRTTVIQRRH